MKKAIENFHRPNGKEGITSKFLKITPEVLGSDEEFAKYLRQADIKSAKKGGAFVGKYEVASDEFRKYGIVLPRGGMIIPDISPKDLRDIIMAEYNVAKKENEDRREKDRKALIEKVEEILTRDKIDDISVVEKNGRNCHGIVFTAVVEVVLRRGDDELLSLRSEKEPPSLSFPENVSIWKDWRVSEFNQDELKTFLQEEVRLAEPRKLFANRINRLIEMSHAVGQQALGEDGWDRPRVELLLYDNYSKTADWGFLGRRCKSVFSAHRIMYRKKLYQLTEEDVVLLEKEVGERAEAAEARQEILKKLFFEHLGVFSYKTRTYEPSEVRHSFLDGSVRDDSLTERHYFLGEKEVTGEEYEWLNTFLGEVKVPEGYIRISNDTNDLLRVPGMPGRNDVLVVEGKTGSRRGVWSYGVWFRGHPTKCEISFWHKGTARKIRKVTLNGRKVDSRVDLSLWKDHEKLAKCALRKAGMERPPKEYVEALTEVYRRLGK